MTPESTITISLPRQVALDLLAARGWTGSRERGWTAPTGTHYRQADEALLVALENEAILARNAR